MIRFQCNHCNSTMRVDEKHAGKRGKCPQCKNPVEIPSNAPEPVIEIDPFELPDLGQVEMAATPLCRNCLNPLAHATATLCSHCGHTVTAGSPTQPRPAQSAGQALPNAFQKPGQGKSATAAGGIKTGTKPKATEKVPVGRTIGAVIVACVIALVAAVVWIAIVGFTGREFGLLAWGIGGLIGLVAGAIARNPSPIFCGSIAAIAGLGILAAKLVMALVLMFASRGLEMIGGIANLDPDHYKVSMAVQEKMVSDGVFEGDDLKIAETQVQNFYSNTDSDDGIDYDDEEMWEKIEAIRQTVNARVEEMSPPARKDMLEQARREHPRWIENHYHYQALLDSLVTSDQLTDEKLIEHARAELNTLDGEYDDEYYETVSTREQSQRRAKLSTMVGDKKETLDNEQLDEVFRDAISNHMTWIPDYKQYLAVMERMHQEKQFSGAMEERVQEILDVNFKPEESSLFDEAPEWEEPDEELELELQRKVNGDLIKLTAKQRQQVIDDLSVKYPHWNNIFGLANEEIEQLDKAIKDTGADGTFWGSLKSVFGFMDILWFILGISSAFAVCRQQGST